MRLRSLSLTFFCLALVALALRARYHDAEGPREAAGPGGSSRTPSEYRRPAEFTFLTTPEWFLVWSSDEYADFMADRPPSEFPFRGHLEQFWQGYGVAYDATKEEYPFNTD